MAWSSLNPKTQDTNVFQAPAPGWAAKYEKHGGDPASSWAAKYEKNGGTPAEPGLVEPVPDETSATQPDTNFGDGDLDIKDDGVFYTPAQTGKESTVAGTLEGLLSRGSPYIEAAKAGAQRQANSRGLLNSSMAATAGEKAGIESALPIAQQDAGFRQEQELTTQQGNIQRGLYETQGRISERLANAGYDHETAMKEMDMEWNKLDLDARMQVEYDKMDKDTADKFNATINSISEDYMNDYLDILTNPVFKNPADRQAAINVLTEHTRNRYDVSAAINGIDIEWPGLDAVETPGGEAGGEAGNAGGAGGNANNPEYPGETPGDSGGVDRGGGGTKGGGTGFNAASLGATLGGILGGFLGAPFGLGGPMSNAGREVGRAVGKSIADAVNGATDHGSTGGGGYGGGESGRGALGGQGGPYGGYGGGYGF